MAHVVDVDGQGDAGNQVNHSETQFEVELAGEGRPGSEEHQQRQIDVGHVGLVDIGVTGVIEF